MNEMPVNTIRETSRNLLVLNRRKHRDEASDVHRSLRNPRITPDAVVKIANKLKTKSMISIPELQTLKNALMDDVANIEVVLNIHGALRGLVRELSGHDVSKQCVAAGCCCNLALGDSKAASAVAKAAGVYLVAALDNFATEIAVTCAWTLGNLAGSGQKACEVMSSQGAVAKLIEMMSSPNEDMREAALYALVHFAYQLKDDFRTEHLNKILQSLPNMDISATSHLLFILSCHSEFTHRSMSEDFIFKLFQTLNVSIVKLDIKDNHTLLNLVRTFANMDSKEVYDVMLNDFLKNNMTDSINKLLLFNNNISDSLLWLLGNMLNCSRVKNFLRIF